MFWKKKKKVEENLFTFETNCRRQFVRVSPPPWAPVDVELNGELSELKDISAGGLACQYPEAKAGDVLPVRIDLPGESFSIDARVEIRSVDGQGVCHAQFLDLTPEMAETIHRYILGVQKSLLKLNKEMNYLKQMEEDE